MSTVIHAISENGVIRLFDPVELSNGEELDVILLKKEKLTPQRSRQILSEIARLPVEDENVNFSGEQHDEILYPKE